MADDRLIEVRARAHESQVIYLPGDDTVTIFTDRSSEVPTQWTGLQRAVAVARLRALANLIERTPDAPST